MHAEYQRRAATKIPLYTLQYGIEEDIMRAILLLLLDALLAHTRHTMPRWKTLWY